MFDLLLPPVLPSWPIPANIRLDEDVMKTSFVFVFRRRLDQYEYVRLSLTSSEDVFKKSSRRLGQNIPLGHMSSGCLQDIFKTSSRHLQGVFNQGILMTSSRRLAKISSRRLQDVSSS